jgi:hypothetical protein
MSDLTEGPLSGPLRVGSTGADVARVQGRLNELLRETPLVTDGNFGWRTGQRLRLYQSGAGLSADAVLGPATAQALGFTQYVGRAAAPRPPQTPAERPSPLPAGPDAPRVPATFGPFAGVVQAVIEAVQGVCAAVKELLRAIKQAFGAATALVDAVVRAIDGVMAQALALLRPLVSFTADRVHEVRQAIFAALDFLFGGVVQALRGFIARFTGPLQIVAQAVAQFIGLGLDALQAVFERVKAWVAQALNGAAAVDMLRQIVAGFRGMIERVIAGVARLSPI